MKNNLKIALQLSIFCLVLLLTSCEKDLYEDQVYKQKITSEKVGLAEVINNVNNPYLKKYLQDNFQNHAHQNNNNLERYTEEELNLIFEKIIKENGYTTYTLILNEYSTEKPYYENLVIKIDGEQDKAGFVKYIPEEPSLFLDIKKFTGKIQLLDIEENVISETDFVDGSPLERQVVGGYCIETISIIVNPCSHGGGHLPGESCMNGNVNDAYYEISTTTFCFYTISYLQPLDHYMASESGGGGSNFSYSNFFKYLELSSQQYGWLTAAENQFFKYRLVSPYCIDSSGSSEDFVISIRDEFRAKLDFLINNPDLTNDIRQYVALNTTMNEQDFAWNTVNQIYEAFNNTIPIDTETILVDSNPSDEINDIDAYLDCFDLSQGAVFTIYVDQPTPNSNESWSGSIMDPDVGHTFISIMQGNIRRVIGFYPGSGVNLDYPETNGAYNNDSAHHYDVALSFNINSTKLINVINYIKNQSGSQYNLNTNNCTDFGIAATRQAGVGLLSAYGTWGLPGLGNGAGDNPGQLGQNIRNMETPSGAVKTTTGGTAPSNMGNCN